MFDVITINDRTGTFSVLVSGLPTLQTARDARCISGDLVVHTGTKNVVQSEEWLWDWELREGYASYAYRKMKGTRE